MNGPITTRRGILALALVFFVLHSQSSALAWSVTTGGTERCHERFTGTAYKEAIPELPNSPMVLPEDDTWRYLADALIEESRSDLDSLNEVERFRLVSLIIGARAPDTDGHSLFNMESLRQIHADPTALGQYTHGLRGQEDDYAEGDAKAIAGTRSNIISEIEKVEDYLLLPIEEQFVKKKVYLSFYGLIDVTIWAPLYHVGFASHTIQDTFSHTIRMEQGGFHKIVHVMNYIDAISADFKEERDGLAHSEIFDNCFSPEIAPLAEIAEQVTIDFYLAVNAHFQDGETDSIAIFLDKWITQEPGCTKDNDYCGNGYWLELARKDQSGPYLAEMFGCSATGFSPPAYSMGGSEILFVLILALSYCLLRRAR